MTGYPDKQPLIGQVQKTTALFIRKFEYMPEAASFI
jgi:hypothetical protein